MDDQPTAVTSSPASSDGAVASEPKPILSPFEAELLGLAVDANELVSQLRSGHHSDLNSMIRRAIDERPAEGSIADEAEPIAELRDAA